MTYKHNIQQKVEEGMTNICIGIIYVSELLLIACVY